METPALASHPEGPMTYPPTNATQQGPLGFPAVSRRELLRIGGASLLGLSLPQLLAAEEAQGRDHLSSRRCVIVIHLNGGPSHLDMWDMKPDAPAEIRGEFKPIATSLPGVQLCEHLPRLARQMHRARSSARCTTASTTPTRRRSTPR